MSQDPADQPTPVVENPLDALGAADAEAVTSDEAETLITAAPDFADQQSGAAESAAPESFGSAGLDMSLQAPPPAAPQGAQPEQSAPSVDPAAPAMDATAITGQPPAAAGPPLAAGLADQFVGGSEGGAAAPLEGDATTPGEATQPAAFAPPEAGLLVEVTDPAVDAPQLDEAAVSLEVPSQVEPTHAPSPAIEPYGLDEELAKPKGKPLVVGLVAVFVVALVVAGLWAFGLVAIPGLPPLLRSAPSTEGGEPKPLAVNLALPNEDKAAATPAGSLDSTGDTEPSHDANADSLDEEPNDEEPSDDTDQIEPPPVEPEPARPPKGKRKRRKRSGKSAKNKIIKNLKQSKQASAGKKPSAEEHYKKANELMRAKKIPAAIDELKKAIAANPRHAKAYRLLGMAYWTIGKQKSAISAWERFIRLDPTHKDVPKVKALIAKHK
jgi:hypothetical protein